MLSIRGTDFIACWAYEERISVHAQPEAKCEHFYMYNLCWAYAERILSHTEHTGNYFIACWAYWEPISSHAEHARKCLKVEDLGRIEYDFQKSRVTGPWDHKNSDSAKKVKKKFHACVPLRIICLFSHGAYLAHNAPQHPQLFQFHKVLGYRPRYTAKKVIGKLRNCRKFQSKMSEKQHMSIANVKIIFDHPECLVCGTGCGWCNFPLICT